MCRFRLAGLALATGIAACGSDAVVADSGVGRADGIRPFDAGVDQPLGGEPADSGVGQALDAGVTLVPAWADDRVRALILQMTVAEKIAQLQNTAPPIDRLKLPAYQYWNEALHGVATDGATSFPQAIALGSTWDTDLVHDVASAISDEARGFSARDGKGLTYWAPVINMLRDPRWGRFEESYSEDPWLMSRMGVAFVRGMQGDDPRYHRRQSCCSRTTDSCRSTAMPFAPLRSLVPTAGT
jgi:beta-glucosidase-like glycosyl hydrolase